jgi:regulator of sigma E protease
MNYFTTILIIGLLIFIHELGHLWAAQAMGIPVTRFSLGFGPVIWRWNRGGIEYCLSLIPLGGYVMPKCDDEEEFMRIPVGRRIVLWLGGPLANFVCAVLLVAAINFMKTGGSAYELLIGPWVQVVQMTGHFLAALPGIFMHPSQLSGIVGIVAAGKTVVDSGLASALKFAVLLNLNLAIFNLLPISPLDGGKIFCALLEKVNPKLARLQTGFAIAGLGLLLLLMVYTTVVDVVRQFA